MATTHAGPAGVRGTAGRRDGARGRALPATVGVAVGSAAVLWALITQVGGVDLRAPVFQGSVSSSPVGLGQVAVASGLASLAAWGILTLMERRVRRVRSVWLATAGVAFLLSLGGPLSGTGVSAADRAFLVLLHLDVAAVVTGLLYASLTARARLR